MLQNELHLPEKIAGATGGARDGLIIWKQNSDKSKMMRSYNAYR